MILNTYWARFETFCNNFAYYLGRFVSKHTQMLTTTQTTITTLHPSTFSRASPTGINFKIYCSNSAILQNCDFVIWKFI